MGRCCRARRSLHSGAGRRGTITLTGYAEGTADLYRAASGGALYLGCEPGLDRYPKIPVDTAFMLRTTSCAELIDSGFCADPQGNLTTSHDGGSDFGSSADLSSGKSNDLGSDLGPELR